MSNDNSPPISHDGARCSPREQQVAELIAQGLSNREIGLALGISYLTVKEHVRRVYAKIGVNNRVAAVLLTVQNLKPNGNRRTALMSALEKVVTKEVAK